MYIISHTFTKLKNLKKNLKISVIKMVPTELLNYLLFLS